MSSLAPIKENNSTLKYTEDEELNRMKDEKVDAEGRALRITMDSIEKMKNMSDQEKILQQRAFHDVLLQKHMLKLKDIV